MYLSNPAGMSKQTVVNRIICQTPQENTPPIAHSHQRVSPCWHYSSTTAIGFKFSHNHVQEIIRSLSLRLHEVIHTKGITAITVTNIIEQLYLSFLSHNDHQRARNQGSKQSKRAYTCCLRQNQRYIDDSGTTT